jgi:hypothetical protein
VPYRFQLLFPPQPAAARDPLASLPTSAMSALLRANVGSTIFDREIALRDGLITELHPQPTSTPAKPRIPQVSRSIARRAAILEAGVRKSERTRRIGIDHGARHDGDISHDIHAVNIDVNVGERSDLRDLYLHVPMRIGRCPMTIHIHLSSTSASISLPGSRDPVPRFSASWTGSHRSDCDGRRFNSYDFAHSKPHF